LSLNKSDCQIIGILAKLHGFRGEFVFASDFYLSEEFKKWESIFLEIEGLLVPFFINSVNITADNTAIISFKDVNSSDIAKEFVSCNVFQLKKLADKLEENADSDLLTGYQVIDKQKGLVGIVDQVLNYNENLLFRVLKDNHEMLIPANEEIIVKVNHKKKEIIIIAPEGLLDL
jgi:16S rRNA processing protein RimM